MLLKGIRVSALATESGLSRQALRAIIYKLDIDPRASSIRAIVSALRRITGDQLRAGMVFDLGDGWYNRPRASL